MSKIFGTRLKEIRIENKCTQQTIANIFNVSKMTISAWETDKQEPSIDDITKLCKFFNVSSDYLLGLEDEAGRKTYDKSFNNQIMDNHGIINQTIR